MLGDDDSKPGFGDELIQGFARFEEGHGEVPAWLGGPTGLLVGFLLLIPTAGIAALAMAFTFATESGVIGKFAFFGLLLAVAGIAAYWKRQRLAAHFERAQRMIESANPVERQSGFTEMIVNARRGRAEHRRIASALAAYLRRPPHDQPGEGARRQVALSVLADYTLQPSAKERIDLSGASLVGLRAVDADLPGVCLRGADLGNVRFVRANLAHADFEGARLEGADFTGARLEGTILAAQAAPPRR